MENFIKTFNKQYSRKTTISISLDEDLVEFLDELVKNTGLNRSKIINYTLDQSRNLLSNLMSEIERAKMLGFKAPGKMRRAIKRAAEKAEKKQKKRKKQN